MTIFYSAFYKNGKSFTFSEDDSGKGDYAKIDRTQLERMEIYNDAVLLHRLHIEEGQRLILRSKTAKTMNAKQFFDLADKEVPLEDIPGVIKRLILVGYQETIKGENRQSITVIFLDDFHTEHISQWKNAPLDAINLTGEEKEQVG